MFQFTGSVAPHVFEGPSSISPEDFEARYINRAIPAVIRGLQDGWGAHNKWSLDWFAQQHGDVELSVDFGGGDRRKTSLADYVRSLDALRETAQAEGAPVPYARTWNYEDDVPSLSADVAPLPHFTDCFQALQENQRPPFTWLFLGPAGAVTPLHVDVWHTDAWLCNFQGRKRFLLFHPGQRRHLEDDAGFVDLNRPDLSRFPSLASATPVECVVGPGDTIYIPRGWPHYVESVEASLSLTVNFLPRCNRARVVDRVAAYARRRAACEALLQRKLRASDNVLKFCVHGGAINCNLAASIMGVTPEGFSQLLEEQEQQKAEEQRAGAGAGGDGADGNQAAPMTA